MFKVLWSVTLNDLDKHTAKQIKNKVETYLAISPLELGKPLTGIYKGLYRYRYGDYRIIYKVLSSELKIIIAKIGHRKDVY